ncbi:hypothetical protein DRJ19_03175 [Candidatus Woesearchaeota archaeon]|nr:MAG: hypothetical protein DRJ19_03175 [Candidatus Woesearchaeota archaeon]
MLKDEELIHIQKKITKHFGGKYIITDREYGSLFHRTYVGEDELGRKVVIKRAFEDYGRRILKIYEKFISNLEPTLRTHIVKLYGSFRIGDEIYFVEEQADTNLELLVGPLAFFDSEEKIINCLEHMVKGLIPFELNGLFHGNLHPRNVLYFRESGIFKLCDFRCDFKLLREEEIRSRGKEITPPFVYYRAPELEGVKEGDKKRRDVRSDFYSIGVILYYILDGIEPPFIDNARQLKRDWDYIKWRIDGNERIDKFFRRILYKLLQPYPEDRYQSVQELLEDLKEKTAVAFPCKYSIKKMSYDEPSEGRLGLVSSIGIIGLGNAGNAIKKTILELSSEIGCRHLYLNTRTDKNLENTVKSARIFVKNKGYDVKIHKVRSENLKSMIESCDLVFICVAHDFGNGLSSRNHRYLEEEVEKLRRRYGDNYRAWPEEVKVSFVNAVGIYNKIGNFLDKKDDFRLFYSLPYNLLIIKKIAEKFKGFGGTVCIFTNPIDIITYVFTLYSNVANVFGCNTYEQYRAGGLFDEIEEYLRERGIKLVGGIYCIGEHGPDFIPVIKYVEESDGLDTTFSVMNELSGWLKQKVEEKCKEGVLNSEEVEKVRKSNYLFKYLKLLTNAYVRERLKTERGRNLILEETEPVVKQIIHGLIQHEEKPFELSIVSKLQNLLDSETLEQLCVSEGRWPNYKEEDKGVAIGWPYIKKNGGFYRVNLELRPEESIEFIETYKKLHDILNILRTIKIAKQYSRAVEADLENIIKNINEIEEGRVELNLQSGEVPVISGYAKVVERKKIGLSDIERRKNVNIIVRWI